MTKHITTLNKGDTISIEISHKKKKVCGYYIVSKTLSIHNSTLSSKLREIILNKKILLIEKDIMTKTNNPLTLFVNAFNKNF